MNIAEFEKDLESVKSALEQALANANLLIGKRQALEDVIAKIKAGAQTVTNTAEQVIDTSPASNQ